MTNNTQNKDKEIIKTRIKDILAKMGKTQKELAALCLISPNDISKAASKGDLSVDKALAISNATGFSLDYIYGNSEYENLMQYVLVFLDENLSVEEKGGTHILKINDYINEYLQVVYQSKQIPFLSDHSRNEIRQNAQKELIERLNPIGDIILDSPIASYQEISEK